MKKASDKQESLLASTLLVTQPGIRHPATYCTPDVKVPGILTLTASSFVAFEPDLANKNVREAGVSKYQVQIEVRDILECGAVAMPLIEPGGKETLAYYLQLHVKTLDGMTWCTQEDVASAWCVVFRLDSRDMLHQLTLPLLDYLEVAKRERGQASPSAAARSRSSTSVPFACLDCVAEVEASLAQQRYEQSLRTASMYEEGFEKPMGKLPSLDHFIGSDSGSDAGLGIVLQPGNVRSPLLTESLATCLFEYLPAAVRIEGSVEWVLRYTPKAHGISLGTLYRSVRGFQRTMLVVQDTEGHVFGGFAPEAWEPCPRFYGSGEAFVFSFGHFDKALPAPRPKVYPWSCDNSYFMHSDDSGLAMGGGNGSHAIFLAADLLRGYSGPTKTFANPMLASAEEFVVKDLEIWAFEEV